MYLLYMLVGLKFSGKTSEEKYAASLGTQAMIQRTLLRGRGASI